MRLKIGFAVAAAAVLVTSPAMTQQERLPDLRVSGIAEPPDHEVIGGKFVNTFTVSNEGNMRARGGTITRAYLSSGRGHNAEDVRLRGSRTTRPIRAGGSAMGRAVWRIPQSIEAGRYYLIVCADDTDLVDEYNDRHNCAISGQAVQLADQLPADNPGPPGAAGPPGAPGAKGEQGPPGDGADFRRLPRTTLAPPSDSTEERDALTVGPFTFQYECVTGPNAFDERARIMVRSSEGSFTMEGEESSGVATNVPAGTEDDLLEATREDSTGTTPDDPATVGDESAEGSVSGFKAVRGYIVHENGTELVADAWAGIDTLGAGTPGSGGDEACIFGGRVTVAP